jgi:hypothetical protein
MRSSVVCILLQPISNELVLHVHKSLSHSSLHTLSVAKLQLFMSLIDWVNANELPLHKWRCFAKKRSLQALAVVQKGNTFELSNSPHDEGACSYVVAVSMIYQSAVRTIVLRVPLQRTCACFLTKSTPTLQQHTYVATAVLRVHTVRTTALQSNRNA